jgi:suppressor of tumorigenicity protein 13
MKIQQHKRKYERKREEKELQARKERVRKAKEAQEKARQVYLLWCLPCSLLKAK